MLSVILIFLLVIIDQLTKWIITKNLVYGMTFTVIGGFFDFTYSRNSGGVFGIFQSAGPYFLIASIIALSLILYFYIRLFNKNWVYRYSLALILAGAVGNIVDRIRLGYVIDFIRLHIGDHFYWPSFNVADASVVIGAFLLLGYAIFKRKPEKEMENEEKNKQI